MRHKIVILICIIAAGIDSLSQNQEPNPWPFRWDTNGSERAFVQDSFPQKNMMLGFQWNCQVHLFSKPNA